MFSVFRASFWLSEKAAAEHARRQRARGAYVWASLHRVQKKMGHVWPLDSTTAGMSTIQNFAAGESIACPTILEGSEHQTINLPERALHPDHKQADSFARSIV